MCYLICNDGCLIKCIQVGFGLLIRLIPLLRSQVINYHGLRSNTCINCVAESQDIGHANVDFGWENSSLPGCPQLGLLSSRIACLVLSIYWHTWIWALCTS